jgi:hypothetical protein
MRASESIQPAHVRGSHPSVRKRTAERIARHRVARGTATALQHEAPGAQPDGPRPVHMAHLTHLQLAAPPTLESEPSCSSSWLRSGVPTCRALLSARPLTRGCTRSWARALGLSLFRAAARSSCSLPAATRRVHAGTHAGRAGKARARRATAAPGAWASSTQHMLANKRASPAAE